MQYIPVNKTTTIVPESASARELLVARIFAEEVKKRTTLPCLVTDIPATDGELRLVLQREQIGPPESYVLEGGPTVIGESQGYTCTCTGADERGLLFGVGKLLRMLKMKPGSLSVPQSISLSSTPRSSLRGHQLGYRPKTNAYDAWSKAQFSQYIRELALFGANAIEILPPRTDDDTTGPLLKVDPLEMMCHLSETIDAYGLDVWIWYPNMANNYADPDTVAAELEEREEIFSSLKRIDAIFVPGGDPGDVDPHLLFCWCAQQAKLLHRFHPKAEIWISPQVFEPTDAWLDSFYAEVSREPEWLTGMVFAPWERDPLPVLRDKIPANIPIRRYPDITHSYTCQYPLDNWDVAYAVTLGRECINPRPLAEKHIHNLFSEYAVGSIGYSEGINDDVNKFIWLDQEWDPSTPALETLCDYSRLFIDCEIPEQIAHGFVALEENLNGPLSQNPRVPETLGQWQTLEKTLPSEAKEQYRFQMGYGHRCRHWQACHISELAAVLWLNYLA